MILGGMSREFQGSKKKARKKAFLERKVQKEHEIKNQLRYNQVMSEGNIEEIALLMRGKLK